MIKENFDLEQFVDMFDTAMNSDNPTVKKCFNNLLMVVALAHAEDKEKHIGPLRKIVDDLAYVSRRLEEIERTIRIMNNSTGPSGTPYNYNSTSGMSYTIANGGAYSTSTVSIPSPYSSINIV